MTNWYKDDLFEFYEDTMPDTLICEVDGYLLFKESMGRRGFLYSAYSPDYDLIKEWISFEDIEKSLNIEKSTVYKRFISIIDEAEGDYADPDYDDYDYDDDPYDNIYPSSNSYKLPYLRNNSYTTQTYTPPAKKTGVAKNLCNSDTLVFHRNDPSTRMLCQVYEGKNWDVLTESCYSIADEEVKELFEKHSRLVFLGHGSPYGLIGMFGPEVAKYMKDKQIFAIWCNADAYFLKYGIGDGQFITGNMPSEVWECRAAGCGNISKELMLENITYWSKLCADVCENCLNGQVKESVEYVRKNYLEKYGNHPVTIYNAERTQVLGYSEPLPKYTFKGQPLSDADKPTPNFNEKEFLENPVPYATIKTK